MAPNREAIKGIYILHHKIREKGEKKKHLHSILDNETNCCFL